MKTDDIEVQVQAVFDEMFRRRLRTDPQLKEGWTVHQSFGTRVGSVPTKAFITEKLQAGHRVRAGYTTTSIRGYHDHHILVGPPIKNKE